MLRIGIRLPGMAANPEQKEEFMKYSIFIVFAFSLLLSGCTNTVGIIELKGKVVDEGTKTVIPNQLVIVEALLQNEDETTAIYAGEFTTDSSGCFVYTLKKVKNASLYNFCIKGNPAYDPSNQVLGLTELNNYGKFLSFEIKRIVDFTMYINRESTTPFRDTLIVSWETNEVDGKTLFPFKIENYHINAQEGLVWIGGDVKSKIITKVYADKNTIVHWELSRNGRHTDIIDTIFCRRNAANNVFLNY
ncbi:MAG: hypothetical protein Q7U54_14160 [Bacteroidales bacterium]|nr:hypothetical protein [Bacteroidales bacterium]